MGERHVTGRTVKSDETLLEIILALKRLEGAGVTEIANEVGVAKSTAHGHLKTLDQYGFVVNEHGRYDLGLRFLDLGETARHRKKEHQLIREKVEELAKRTDERAQFIVQEHGYGIYLYRSIGAHAVSTDSRIGKRISLHASSAGKAILAHLPEEEVVEILERRGLPPSTENTITDVDTLYEELEAVRERGYAFNMEESTTGLRAVGVPVIGSNGEVLGSLSVSGPTHRLKGEWFETEIPDMILGAANEVELNITFS
ncbi:IclR family transcriptional regulator [Haloferax sp. YSMS24]|uniref:IclR family transcriptional regulator n=1 Tax=unclassified Haloferax TaxID=2625095 RepID=UPI00398CF62D